MKIFVGILVCMMLLAGCGTEQTFETVADEAMVPAMAQPRQIRVELPGEAALPVMENDSSRLYLGRDYEILVQTLPGGDRKETIRRISGFDDRDLTLVETGSHPARLEFVWVSAAEEGEALGRCVILDDGNYHYCLSVLRQQDSETDMQTNWDQVFDSFALV